MFEHRHQRQVLSRAPARGIEGIASHPRLIAIVFAILAGWTAGTAFAEPARLSVRYFNERFGFSLALPVDVFDPASSRGQDEGSLWVSRDGEARLLAVAGPNDARLSLSEYRQFVLRESYPDAVVDYAPIRDTWFVLSGRKQDTMFYERINFLCDGRYIYGWQMTYPVGQRARYDAIVEQIHKTYRAGRGEDGKCGRSAERQPAREQPAQEQR